VGKYRDYGNYLAFACPVHKQCRASRFRVKFGTLNKRFKSYEEAQRFLTGVRFKTDENTFDMRDYMKDNPLSFTPEMPFFRHANGKPFGRNHFYRYWKKACKNLGIEGVDLYGGTKHSSARALRRVHSPEEIQRAMMTKTNKAFERYFRIESEDARMVYQSNRGQVIPLKKTGEN
jgi:hypothetical protein